MLHPVVPAWPSLCIIQKKLAFLESGKAGLNLVRVKMSEYVLQRELHDPRIQGRSDLAEGTAIKVRGWIISPKTIC